MKIISINVIDSIIFEKGMKLTLPHEVLIVSNKIPPELHS